MNTLVLHIMLPLTFFLPSTPLFCNLCSKPNQCGKFPVTAFVALLTIIVYALTNYKVYKAKQKNNCILASATPLVKSKLQEEQENMFSRYFPFAQKSFWSVLDLVTLYIVVIMFVAESIQWNFYQKKLSVMEMKTTASGHFYYIYHLKAWEITILVLEIKFSTPC